VVRAHLAARVFTGTRVQVEATHSSSVLVLKMDGRHGAGSVTHGTRPFREEHRQQLLRQDVRQVKLNTWMSCSEMTGRRPLLMAQALSKPDLT